MEDYLSLSVEEKKQAIRSRIKNLQYAKYEVELSIRLEGVLTPDNQFQIDSLNNQLADINSKEQELLVILGELG